MQKNMTFPQAVADRINAPLKDMSWDDLLEGKGSDLPLVAFPTRDFKPLPEKRPIPSPIENGELGWDNDDDYMADVRRHYWHYAADGFEHPPETYYEYYSSPALRRTLAKNNNKLFHQYPKLLEAFKEWRSK